ncbi:glycosyltransferase [Dictyobacter arantiisoli]|uniref:Transferase n=1 Tax=Dictyobacter arantiisoli TaxID=2014874 RepID=A0A5A5T845_9CHLR|nr:glycosyltransferase [Dictyobacter arantiisoli]GCF07517.1 transferase [Dictyobacter arantiisoli]
MDRRIQRIAFLSEHASPLALRGGADAGGQNVYVSEVSSQLASFGYQVDIFTRRDAAAIPEIVDWAPGVRVISVIAGPLDTLPKDLLWPYMPAFRDNILHIIDREQSSYDLIHSNFWMSGWVAIELKQRLGIPVVHIFHAMGKTKQRNQGDMDSSPGERIAVETQIIQSVDRLLAQCPSEEQELIEDYGADPQKVIVIPSAVNTEIFHPVERAEARSVVGLDPSAFVVAYVGRLLPRKDIRNVVRGVAQLIATCEARQAGSAARIKLLIVGGETVEPDPVVTPEIGVLQKLAAELGISEHLHFIGKRQQDVLCYYYGAGDVVVTTPWYEPFGLTPLEGMACGRPVIGSAVGGITYTVVDNKTGFLIPPKNPAALAQRLQQLLQAPELCLSMGQTARQRVEQSFSWSTTALHTAIVYADLLISSLSESEQQSELRSPRVAVAVSDPEY